MEMTVAPPRRFRHWLAAGVLLCYFLGSAAAGRIDGPHIGLAILIAILYGAHAATRAFLATFFPMLLYLLCYDLVHYLPMQWRQPIHVESLYAWESAWFGFTRNDTTILPHEWFRAMHWAWTDIGAAITYNFHYIAPTLFGFFLWRRNRFAARQFAWAFFWLNMGALLIQLTFPTAPPWYVNRFGFTPADPLLPGDAAGLARVDLLLGRPYFTNMYRMSAIVFGAMPSMHAAWPILIAMFIRGFPRGWIAVLIGYTLCMWGSAVYLQHHYIVDLLVGGTMAVIAAAIIRLYIHKYLKFS